jgi:hypothetical protein
MLAVRTRTMLLRPSLLYISMSVLNMGFAQSPTFMDNAGPYATPECVHPPRLTTRKERI